jgi:hypothetical protein
MLWNSLVCLDCLSFELFDSIKILAQIIVFFQEFNKMKNNLVYVEMVKVL